MPRPQNVSGRTEGKFMVRADDEGFRHSQIEVGGSSLHVVEAGDPDGRPVLLLHGWPESWSSWAPMMRLAARQARMVAIDLPGIGGSTGYPTDGSKHELAMTVDLLVSALGLTEVTLVGQDVGGMIAYSCLRAIPGLARVVIMNVVVPGIDPWEEVRRNPYLWHFAFHSVPALPETLVSGREREYFDFFYDALSADPARISDESRAEYVEAYSAASALSAGLSWYRGFPRDAEANASAATLLPVTTPVLYLRGEAGGGQITDYADGLRAAGVTELRHALIPGAGHFAQQEAPEATWKLIAEFAGL